MTSAWSWVATLCLGGQHGAGQHRAVPVHARSSGPWCSDLPSLVDQAAFVLCFVPASSSQQAAEIVANTLSATTQARIELQLDGAEAVADPAGVPLPTETHPWGRVHIVHETPAAGLYHLQLAPGGLIPRHIHERLAEVELVVSAGVRCQDDGRPAPGTILSWPRRAPHAYRNTDPNRAASILCVNQPRFDHVDEIVVDESVRSSATLDDARRGLCHDPWTAMLAQGAEFRFAGAFSGQDVTYYVRDEIRPDADAALIAIVDGSEIVICRHHRRGWELPGGKRDPGESIHETAHREAMEETGITLNPDLTSLGYFVGVGGGGPRHVKQVFMATIAQCGDQWQRDEIPQVGRADPVEFAARASAIGDPDISVLCRDAVVPIIAALVRGRLRQ